MTATESIAEFSKRPTLHSVTRLLVEQTRETLAGANAFRQWTREHLMLHKPNPEDLEQHNKVCRGLIWVLRLAQLALSDPNFPDKQFAEEVAFTIRRLTEDWEMIHNAISEDEAKKIIPELFAA
jgi:hypothetical protein